MKSIIKRIIIGVAIGLILFFLKSYITFAKAVDTYALSTQGYTISSNTDKINISLPNIFSNYGDGFVLFDFFAPIGGSYVNQNVLQVDIVYNNGFVSSCELFRSAILDQGAFYSVKCDAILTNKSLSSIRIQFQNIQSSSVAPIYVKMGTNITFVSDNNNSAIVNAIIANSSKNNTATIIGQLDSIASDFGTVLSNIYLKIDAQYSIQNQQLQQQQQTNQKLDETNDFLKDDSLPTNASGDIGDLNSNIATNGTISSLVTMPITFLQKIISGLNGTCSPIVIGELYEYNMTMPCINPQQYIGIIWNIIDVICAGFISFHFGKKLVSIFHKITSMKDGGLEEAYD